MSTQKDTQSQIACKVNSPIQLLRETAELLERRLDHLASQVADDTIDYAATDQTRPDCNQHPLPPLMPFHHLPFPVAICNTLLNRSRNLFSP
jgi:hypothetical protein